MLVACYSVRVFRTYHIVRLEEIFIWCKLAEYCLSWIGNGSLPKFSCVSLNLDSVFFD